MKKIERARRAEIKAIEKAVRRAGKYEEALKFVTSLRPSDKMMASLVDQLSVARSQLERELDGLTSAADQKLAKSSDRNDQNSAKPSAARQKSAKPPAAARKPAKSAIADL